MTFGGCQDDDWKSEKEDLPDDEVIGPLHPKPKTRADWKAEATSTLHLMTHRPANKYCKICRVAKTRHKRHQRRLKPLWDTIKNFGDVVTFDHFDCVEFESQSKQGHTHG